MTYGLERQLAVESGAMTTAAQIRSVRSSSMDRAWHGLTADCRLAAVERRLSAVNTLSDGYPPAL